MFFHRPNKTLPMIISSFEQDNKTLEGLKYHEKTLEWIMSNLKRINPSSCMHQIYD